MDKKLLQIALHYNQKHDFKNSDLFLKKAMRGSLMSEQFIRLIDSALQLANGTRDEKWSPVIEWLLNLKKYIEDIDMQRAGGFSSLEDLYPVMSQVSKIKNDLLGNQMGEYDLESFRQEEPSMPEFPREVGREEVDSVLGLSDDADRRLPHEVLPAYIEKFESNYPEHASADPGLKFALLEIWKDAARRTRFNPESISDETAERYIVYAVLHNAANLDRILDRISEPFGDDLPPIGTEEAFWSYFIAAAADLKSG